MTHLSATASVWYTVFAYKQKTVIVAVSLSLRLATASTHPTQSSQ